MSISALTTDCILKVTPSTGDAVEFCFEDVNLNFETDESTFDCSSQTTELAFPGLKRWSGSWNCALDDTVNYFEILSDTTKTFTLQFTLVNLEDEELVLSGTIVISRLSMSVEQKKVPKLAVEFAGSGNLDEHPAS